MADHVTVSFRVRDKGGSSGGKTLSREAPSFDWEVFRKTPNAEEFVKKTYYATVKKIVREIEENKNGSVAPDLDSFETVIARALSYTHEEIMDWIRTRDWARAQVPNIEELMPEITRYFPELASRVNRFDQEPSAKIAWKIVAAVADNPDPIADFLFTMLTTKRQTNIELEPL